MDHGDDQAEAVHPAVRGLKTVCRCNNIKFRTIERALREGATGLSQVAARTTATAGQCGGTCTPEVLQMIADYKMRQGPAASHPAKKGPLASAGSANPAAVSRASAGTEPQMDGQPDTSGDNVRSTEWWVRKK